jgi:hypothetical protein
MGDEEMGLSFMMILGVLFFLVILGVIGIKKK